MALGRLYNDNESVPNGSAPSGANTGGGRNIAYTQVSAVGSLLGSTTNPLFGKVSLSVAATATVVSLVGWSGMSGTIMSASCYASLPNTPTTAHTIIQLRSASAQAANLNINTSGQLVMADATGATIGSAIGSLTAFWGTRLQFLLIAIAGTTTINGTIGVAVRNHAGTILTQTTGSVNAGGGTSTTMTEARFGLQGSAVAWSASGTLFFDAMSADDTTSSFLNSWDDMEPVRMAQRVSGLYVPVGRAALR